MAKPTDIRIVDVLCEFESVPFRAPLKFGGRVQTETTLINVEVTAETANGDHAIGYGSMPTGSVWAWPSEVVEPDQATKAIQLFAEEACHIANDYPEFSHPLESIYQISAEYSHLGKSIANRLHLDEPMPALAQMVAASPLDAAVHDAFGRVNEINSYDGLGAEFIDADLSEFLDEQFTGEYLDQYTSREPKAKMPLYHLVGALDPLTADDIATPIKDKLPETLPEWIAADGLTHLKIKLSGDDMDWDIDRVLSVENVSAEAQKQRGCENWFYSLDFNEKCENVEYIITFLNKIREKSPAAYDRVQYIEQPTHRDLKKHPDNKMHEAAKLKPVVIDESLVDYESLLLARELGYSGVALKACKGQTETLFMAAAAQKFDMFLCVQDLTCPGYSFLHSASIAARIPTVTAIEGNGRQYCPGPNRRWKYDLPGMFNITDGTVETSILNGYGLGF